MRGLRAEGLRGCGAKGLMLSLSALGPLILGVFGVPLNPDLSCPPGSTDCLQYLRLGVGDQKLLREGAGAACAFGADDQSFYLASPQYKEIYRFDKPTWNTLNCNPSACDDPSETFSLPCAPRGFAIAPSGGWGLVVCPAEGEVYNLSLSTKVVFLVSEGIDFSPGFHQGLTEFEEVTVDSQGRGVLEGAPNSSTTIMQCDVNSFNMMVGIVFDEARNLAYISNRNWNQVVAIRLSLNPYTPMVSVAGQCHWFDQSGDYNRHDPCREYFKPPQYNDIYSQNPSAVDQGRTAYRCCSESPTAKNYSCCNYKLIQEQDPALNEYPTSISISPDSRTLSNPKLSFGTAFPGGEIWVYSLDTSTWTLSRVEGASKAAVGLTKYSYATAWAYDNTGIWVGSYWYSTLAKVLVDSEGKLQAPAHTVSASLSTFKPRAICLSQNGTHMGILSDAGSAILGSDTCNLVEGCTPCPDVVPPDASFAFNGECEWQCNGGKYWQTNATNRSLIPTGVKEGYGPGACVACPPGTYFVFPTRSISFDVTACVQCPLGKFGLSSGASSVAGCSDCNAGSSTLNTGANTSAACVECSRGYYTNGTGTPCLPCAAGTYSNVTGVGSVSGCIPCANGTASNISAATGCVTCAAGKFTRDVGASICIDYPSAGL